MDRNEQELTMLAEKINAGHQRIESGLRTTLADAVEVGKWLILAQDKVEGHKWVEWMENNLTFSVRTAQKYKRVANHATEKGEYAPFPAHMGVDESFEFIADVEEDDASGMTPEEIAAVIAEREKAAAERSAKRDTRVAEQSEDRKFHRKMVTLKTLARVLPEIDYEPSEEERESLRKPVIQLAHWLGVPIAEEVAAGEVACGEAVA